MLNIPPSVTSHIAGKVRIFIKKICTNFWLRQPTSIFQRQALLSVGYCMLNIPPSVTSHIADKVRIFLKKDLCELLVASANFRLPTSGFIEY